MRCFYITDSSDIAEFYKTRDMEYPKSTEIFREISNIMVKKQENNHALDGDFCGQRFYTMKNFLKKIWGEVKREESATVRQEIGEEKRAQYCPYCQSKDFVKRGLRKKKYESAQLYLCRNEECKRTFTAQSIKGKHFPLNLIVEGMSYYNLGYGLEDTCRLLNQKFGVNPGASTLSNWIDQYKSLCRYERLRPYALKLYEPKDMVEVTSMAHRHIYRFRYHRAKMRLTIKEMYKHKKFEALKDYLDAVSSETPHQYFQDGIRISEIKTKFDKSQMIVRSKKNYANMLADFVLQAVKENKMRHEALQRFFIANDSVTVASEVPVYIRKEEIEHMENQLNFKILEGEDVEIRGRAGKARTISAAEGLPRLLTGH